MNITIPKKDLIRLLARCQGVADKKSTMPVLTNVLIEVDTPGLVRVAATDMYLAVSSTAAADTDGEGSIAVPARDIFERVKAMPDGPVTIRAGASGNTELRSDTSARRYALHSLDGSSFPALPEPDSEAPSVQLEVNVLHKIISQTKFSIATDDSRGPLSSALFEWEEGLVRMVTADRHRLTKVEVDVRDSHETSPMLIPSKGIVELQKLAEEAMNSEIKADGGVMVTITTSGPNAFFSFGDVLFSVKLTDAKFPAYQNAILKASQRSVHIPSRLAFMDALKAVSLAASDRTGGVKITVEHGTMRIESQSPEAGEGYDEMVVDYYDEATTIGFNAKYLTDVLSALVDVDEVDMQLFGELDPIIIKPSKEAEGHSFLSVVMPMRL